MAYANKYKITYATKTSKTAYLYIQEDGYAGDLIEYPGMSIQLQYLPTSDDPFEPILASQLNVVIDITDDMANMPDFVTTNDRKYFAKLFLGTDLEWTGFTINDDVQISFSTGRKQLAFNCVDGLAMLKNVPLAVSQSENINAYQKILTYITLCLNSVQLPTNPNIITACSYFSDSMVDRGASSANEPFNQAYLPSRTFLDSSYIYISSFDVLSNILKSFGCRLFMAGGKWWIISINEFAKASVYYTEYSYISSVVGSGQFTKGSQIQGFTSNTSNVYFIDNSQLKILKKGFNAIQTNHQTADVKNFLSNGNFKPNSVNQADNWYATKSGTSSVYTIINNADEAFGRYRLVADIAAGSYVRLRADGLPRVNVAEIFTFNWSYFNQDTGGYRGNVYISIVGASSTYYWGGDTIGWTTNVFTNFFQVPSVSNDTFNTFSFSTKPAPITGDLTFKFALEDGTTRYVIVGNFVMTITPVQKQIDYFSSINSNTQYINNIDLPYGFYASTIFTATIYPTELGVITTSTGVPMNNWYEYGKAGSYSGLMGLIMQMYINIFAQKIINVDGSLSSFETSNGYINAAKSFTATDTDPSQINISSNYYLLGNSTIDYVADSTSVTLLQISDTYISSTNTLNITYNQN
jgi:hypothetical protein